MIQVGMMNLASSFFLNFLIFFPFIVFIPWTLLQSIYTTMPLLLSLLSLLVLPASAAAASSPPPNAAIEPYEYLSGGSFSGPSIPYHPDPLARYVWNMSQVNASALQIFDLLPTAVSLMPGTLPGSFQNASSLLGPGPLVTVMGFGGLEFDYGVENAAWLEFDSADLTPQDLAGVTLAVSEYNEYEIVNLGAKVGQPVPHAIPNTTTYRLELPHPDLYEGVRFAWLMVNATPSAPWTITALRLVCQIKPTNWGGAFAAAGDVLLSKIWYMGAYCVKVNLLSDQFGSILIYRGDRFSWTGSFERVGVRAGA
jgi:alpha-L-rhamnosidase